MICRRNLIVVITIVALVSVGMLMSCGGRSDKDEIEKRERVLEMDSLVRVHVNKNTEDALAYIDGLEKSGSMSKSLASYERAIVYNAMKQKTTSELYFKKALEGDELLEESPSLFYKACDYLSSFLSNRGENAEALAVATRCYEVVRQDNSCLGRRSTAVTLHAMGYFQTQLGMREQAENNFSMAYMALSQMANSDKSYENLRTFARVSYNILDAYTSTEQYDKAVGWLDSAEKAAESLSESPECSEQDRVNYVGGVAIHRATVMLKLGSIPSAELYYKKAKDIGYFDTSYGIMEQAHFLRKAERWNELVNVMPRIDSLSKAWDVPMSLPYMKEYMVPQFNAYMLSGQKDKALEIAEKMAVSMDSVASHELNHKMNEIAVITAQKDKNTAAAEQKAAEAYKWVKILSIALSFLIVCIMAYSVFMFVRSRRR